MIRMNQCARETGSSVLSALHALLPASIALLVAGASHAATLSPSAVQAPPTHVPGDCSYPPTARSGEVLIHQGWALLMPTQSTCGSPLTLNLGGVTVSIDDGGLGQMIAGMDPEAVLATIIPPPCVGCVIAQPNTPCIGSEKIKAYLEAWEFYNSSTGCGRVAFRATGAPLYSTNPGFCPDQHYHELLYDIGSVSCGPNSCIPSTGMLSFPQMQIASYEPIGNQTRWLCAERQFCYGDPNSGLINPSSKVPLTAIGTISIRRHDQAGPAASLPLVACGRFNLLF